MMKFKYRCGKWDSGRLHVYSFEGRLVCWKILGGRCVLDGIKSQIIGASQSKMKSLFVVCRISKQEQAIPVLEQNIALYQTRPHLHPLHRHTIVPSRTYPSTHNYQPKNVLPRHPQLPPHLHHLPLRLPPPQPHLHHRRRLQHRRPLRLARLPRPPCLLHRKRPPLPRLARHRPARRRPRPAEREPIRHQPAHGQSARELERAGAR